MEYQNTLASRIDPEWLEEMYNAIIRNEITIEEAANCCKVQGTTIPQIISAKTLRKAFEQNGTPLPRGKPGRPKNHVTDMQREQITAIRTVIAFGVTKTHEKV